MDTEKIPTGSTTWAGCLPYLFAILETGTEEGKRIAREELKKMASAADAYNTLISEKDEFIHPEFEGDLNGNAFKGLHYGYKIEQTGNSPEAFTLTIYSTSLSKLDGDDPGETWEYLYDYKGDAEKDIKRATEQFYMIYDPL